MAELYSLPDGWEWKKLDDFVSIKGGKRIPKGKKLLETKTNYPYIRVTDFNDFGSIDLNNIQYITEDIYNEIKNYIISKDDIYISIAGTIGKTGIIPNELDGANLTENAAKFVFDNSKYDKFFLLYFTNSIPFLEQIGLATKTVAMPKLALTRLKEVEIPLPPFEEQKRIVDKLDNLFAKIDKAIALHQKNIDEADIFMASVLNDVFVELEEKYGLIKINDVVVKTKNKNPLNEKDTPFTYIDISSIDNKLFKIVEPKQLIGSEAPSRAKKEVFQGDIIYSTTRPNLKNIAIVSENYNNPIASTGFCVLRTNEKTINYYLFYFLITEKLFEQIEPNIRGAQYPATSDNDLKNCNIPNTPYETQQKVVSYLDEISNKMEKIKQIQKEKMQSLKELKASILDKAFKGEL